MIINLNKRHFPKYLNNVWSYSSVDPDTLNVAPIELIVDSAAVYLNPSLDHSIDETTVTFMVNNSEPLASIPPGLIRFEALSALVGSTIDSTTELTVSLSIDNGLLNPEEWKDLYILLNYRVEESG